MSNKNTFDIPFFNPHADAVMRKPIQDTLLKVLADGQYLGGKYVDDFEKEFAAFHGKTQQVIACASGTAALKLCLQSCNVQAGDSVLVPALTWVATAEAVIALGAIPVMVDVDMATGCMALEGADKRCQYKSPKAIIIVHLYGFLTEMKAWQQLAKKYNCYLIEDCAQAHGAFRNGMAGTFGHMAAFSFYPTKNLGAIGDAGAVLTNDKTLAQPARLLANHGQTERHNHIIAGDNYRMDAIQAAVLSLKLPRLAYYNQQRALLAQDYTAALRSLPLQVPEYFGDFAVFHLYVLRTPKREALAKYLAHCGIQTSLHYPRALTALPPMKAYVKAPCRVAEKWADECLSLPLYPGLAAADQQKIINAIKGYFA